MEKESELVTIGVFRLELAAVLSEYLERGGKDAPKDAAIALLKGVAFILAKCFAHDHDTVEKALNLAAETIREHYYLLRNTHETT